MKRILLTLMTILALSITNLQAQKEVFNQVYSDLQFMLMPSFNSIMMGNFNLGIGFQRKDNLGFGLGFHLDGIHLPNLSIISGGLGLQYRYAVNGIILKPEIGFSELSIKKEEVEWHIEDMIAGYYFRQEVTIQFTKAMTVGMSAIVYPFNRGRYLYSEFEASIDDYSYRSIAYLNFHFGFTIYGRKRKKQDE